MCSDVERLLQILAVCTNLSRLLEPQYCHKADSQTAPQKGKDIAISIFRVPISIWKYQALPRSMQSDFTLYGRPPASCIRPNCPYRSIP
jgi:hypothetical protein